MEERCERTANTNHRANSTLGYGPTLAAYTFAHFSVDFCCFFVLYASFVQQAPEQVGLGFLLYNGIAFGMQPLFGALCDARPRFPAAPLGCFLVLCALIVGKFSWLPLVVCAVGNALFHVGGGVNALSYANGRMARGGVFVSSGALGVALGTLCGGIGLWLRLLPMGLAAFSMVLCLLAYRRDRRAPCTMVPFGAAAHRGAAFILVLCCVSIFIRAWVGGLVPMLWKQGVWLGLLPAVAACAGKAVGGFAADALGARLVGVGSLLLSAVLLCFGNQWAVTSLLGLFLFNFTMPVTLCAVADRLPGAPGLAFGLTTLALLCGTLPLFLLPRAAPLAVSGAAILASALCLLFALAPKRRGKKQQEAFDQKNRTAQS